MSDQYNPHASLLQDEAQHAMVASEEAEQVEFFAEMRPRIAKHRAGLVSN